MGKLNMVNLEKNKSHPCEFSGFAPLNHIELSQPLFFCFKVVNFWQKQNTATKWQKFVEEHKK